MTDNVTIKIDAAQGLIAFHFGSYPGPYQTITRRYSEFVMLAKRYYQVQERPEFDGEADIWGAVLDDESWDGPNYMF